MPRVTKQTSGKTTSGKDPWDKLEDVSEMEAPFTLTLYGRSGTGKTRLLGTFPKPLLVIGSERGVGSIKGYPKGQIKYFPVRTSDDYAEALDIARSGKFPSVGLDQATELANITLKEILGLEELPAQSSWGMATQQQYGTAALQMKERLRALMSLAETGIKVVIVAHERNFNDESGTSSDLGLLPTVGAALSPSVTGWLNGHSEYIAETYIRQKQVKAKVKINGKEKEIMKDTKEPEFCLRVGPNGVFTTKFRVPEGVELPDVIVNPHWDKIVKLIGG